jgi:hypothetical protein
MTTPGAHRDGEQRSAAVTPSAAAENRRMISTVSQRLLAEFDATLDLGVVTRIVASCLRDLDAVPPAALPELLERSARERVRAALEPRSGEGC